MYYNYPECIPTVNIGDYIQSLAAAQYLPDDCHPVLINREKLSDYSGEPVKMIMNGWYMHDSTFWPPSQNINPLYVAFHISRDSEKQMLSLEGVNYFKKHAPIGCRDEDTLQMLQKRGVEAYYSACLTLTLDKKYTSLGEKSNEIIFVDTCLDSKSFFSRKLENRNLIENKEKNIIESIDIDSKNKPELFYQTYKEIFPESILKNSAYIRHEIPKIHFTDEKSKFQYAKKLLDRYSKAQLIVTSRIHCALPCLALGTPVIYVHDARSNKKNQARVGKLLELFNIITISKKTFSSQDIDLKALKSDFNNFRLSNKANYKKYAEKLKVTCDNFIK